MGHCPTAGLARSRSKRAVQKGPKKQRTVPKEVLSLTLTTHWTVELMQWESCARGGISMYRRLFGEMESYPQTAVVIWIPCAFSFHGGFHSPCAEHKEEMTPPWWWSHLTSSLPGLATRPVEGPLYPKEPPCPIWTYRLPWSQTVNWWSPDTLVENFKSNRQTAGTSSSFQLCMPDPATCPYQVPASSCVEWRIGRAESLGAPVAGLASESPRIS